MCDSVYDPDMRLVYTKAVLSVKRIKANLHRSGITQILSNDRFSAWQEVSVTLNCAFSKGKSTVRMLVGDVQIIKMKQNGEKSISFFDGCPRQLYIYNLAANSLSLYV